MRIGLDISAAFAGASGIRFYVEELLGGLSRVGVGHEFWMYSSFWKDPGRFETLRLPRASNFKLLFKRVPQRVLLMADEYLPLGIQERWCRSIGLDVFHGLGNSIPPFKVLPSALTIHHVGGAPDTSGLWSSFYFKTQVDRSVRGAGAVIAVSEFARRQVIEHYGLPETKVVSVLEGGPDPAFRLPSAEESRVGADLPCSKPYVLYVGGIYERKNLVNLVRAFAALRAGRSAPPRLVLAGRPGNYYSVVAAAAKELFLEKEVFFLSGLAQKEIVRLYQHADVFVYPSLLEGFGFPVLEAMACGAPVVAAASGSIPEVAGGAAALVDGTDVPAMAEAIAKVLDDPEWAGELRRRGAKRCREFSWDQSAKETLAVYARVIKDAKIGGPR